MNMRTAKKEYQAARNAAENYFRENKDRLSELMRTDAQTPEREEINAEYMRLKMIELSAWNKVCALE